MRHLATVLTLMVLFVATPATYGQAGPALGDDFIFFVNGTNTIVPSFDGTIVADPDDATNSVVQYDYGNWSFQAFRFDAATGVDMSQNRADGDVLHLKLWVDPANAGMERIELMFEDKTDNSGADDGSADLPFRLVWRVPESMRDGEWHTLEIPLPPATYRELEAAKSAGTLDGLAQHWLYAGAWSTGQFGVALADEAGPNTAERPELWREFEWTNVQNLGFFWDNNTGGGRVLVDDVYIGAPGLDLSTASQPPTAMSGVTFEATRAGNRISWTHSPEFSAYNVYASANPITDVRGDSSVGLIGSVPHSATDFEVIHKVELLHPSLEGLPMYYAVTSLSGFGVENTSTANSSGSITNRGLPLQAYITELTESEASSLFDDLAAGNASGAGFPNWLEPFSVNVNHSSQADSPTWPVTDDDLSAKVWAGYSAQNELFIYAEITDDQISLAPSSVPASDAWQHDSIEFGWGNYDVRDAGGSLFAGSPHTDMERGEFADYQFRISGHGDGTRNGTTPYAYVGWSIDAVPQGGGAAYDVIETNGMVTGYKVLALFPLDAIQNLDQGDAVPPVPTGTDIRYMPFNIALNDGDGAGRDTQIQWSTKSNAGSQWWNTPAQWMTVAMAGRQSVTAGDEDAGSALGDDFIFFVNGTNVIVPSFDGNIIADPEDASNPVIQYNYGNWSYQAFRFDGATGVDMSQNRTDGDVLHLRLWVDPANAGMPNIALMMEDKTDYSGADDGSADLPFRLVWRVPEDLRDGQWHDLEIPLPPATWRALEDAKDAGTLDDLAQHWLYAGAWSTGGWGVALTDEMGPFTTENPDLWQEFEWTNVQNLGFFFDNNTGGGPVLLDDVFIGSPGLDLSEASGLPSAMSGVSFQATMEGNRISWTHNPEFSAYNVYSSPDPITAFTDVRTDPGVAKIGSVPHTATSFELIHKAEVLHPSLAGMPLYYAVTSLSSFGVENASTANSSGMITNPDLAVQAYITELTDSEASTLFDDLSAGNASGAGFPDWLMPFSVDTEHSSQADGAVWPVTDEDLSAQVWAGYSADNELFIYAEVTDDQITLAPTATPPSDAWQHDSIEFGWGNYDVRDAGGTLFTGTPHQDMGRGEYADYQFRLSGHGDGTKAGTTPYTYVGWSINASPQGGGAAYDVIETNGVVTGYKMLGLFPLDAIQNMDQGDAVPAVPSGTDIRFMPFNIALNDGDGANRDAQIQWSINGNAGSQWWNTPAQWMTVAMAGRLTVTDVEEVEELPGSFALGQNYPNPFNPATSIQFALPASEKVTLRVFDLLGRPVATLLDGQSMAAGTHTVQFDGSNLASGHYIYRLEAGGVYVESKWMVLVK